MKFNGEKIRAMAEDDLVLPRPDGKHLTFHVRALGLGEDAEAKKLFPDPEAPYGFYKDDRGRPLRDPDTGKTEAGPLFSEPGFLAAVDRAERMRMIVKFVKALDADSRITWDAPGEGVDFYAACETEIRESGITDGDMNLVLRRAFQLGNLDSDSIKRAAEAFSERERAHE